MGKRLARLDALRPGDWLETGKMLPCIPPGSRRRVKEHDGRLYVSCGAEHGAHYLDELATGEELKIAGVYKAKPDQAERPKEIAPPGV